MKIIAIDFDGCLVESQWPLIGRPREEVFKAALAEKARGSALILWTCRTGKYLDDAVKFCRAHGLEFDAVNDNLPETIAAYGGSNCRKIVADEYWDDCAVRMPAPALKTDRLGLYAVTQGIGYLEENPERSPAYCYVDKHDREIKPGMLIRIGDDPPERVYRCCTQEMDEDLGINASNEDYLKHHPDAERVYYSLINFPSGIIEIVKEDT